MKGLKGGVDEGGVQVPFFVRWDGRIKAGVDVGQIAAHIDFFPTLVALAGAQQPAGQVEGRSLLPLIEGKTTPWADRYIYTHKGRWKTGSEPNEHQWQNFAVRNQRFRLVNNTTLYDMRTDPGQKTNVIEEHPAVVKAMREAYDAWWKKTRPMMVNETAEMSPTRPYHVLYEKQLKAGGIPMWKAPEL